MNATKVQSSESNNSNNSSDNNKHSNAITKNNEQTVTPKQFSSELSEFSPTSEDKKIATWLFILCAMVFFMVILGGVTRLTESGMEWSHRFWGRIIGVAYLLPYLYFLSKGYIKDKGLQKSLGVIFLLGGLQGALGWYMVKSGLEVDVNSHETPRVSHYRLVSHLSSAFALYTAMLWTGMGLVVQSEKWSNEGSAERRLRTATKVTAALIATTVVSGGFVAGLDAGLSYNTWPLMAGQWIPEDILIQRPVWKNFFDNSTTVQFDHRNLAYSAVAAVGTTWVLSRRASLSSRTRTAFNALAAVVAMQASLGVITLLSFVPTPLAAAHQAGSLTLLSAALWCLHQVRRGPKNIRASPVVSR